MSLLEKYASQIVNTVRDPLLVLDGDATVQFANAAYYRAFDEVAQRTVGRAFFELGNGQWDVQRLRELIASVVSGQPAFDGVDVTHEFDRIGTRCMRVTGRHLDDSDAERFVLVSIQDVTLEKKAELELGRRLGELAVSNEALSHFAGITAHDLREPLRKLRSYGELLAESAAAKLDDTERAHLDRMISASERLRQLIEASLTLARVSTGAVRQQSISLRGVVDDVLGEIDVLVREAGAVVEVGALPRVEADPALMRAVFQNLFVNAIKFRRADVPPRVRVHARPRTSAVEVLVEDNGLGFPADEAERIFQPFLRLHPRGTYDGAGIGLAVCRRVVERHHGTITARGAPGSGSTFVLTLPTTEGT